MLVGVPSQVADRLAADAAQGLFADVKLALHDLRFRKEDEVQARLLVGKRTVGRFVLSVHVREVTARLRPGRPRLRFAADRIDVTILPGSAFEGEGRAFLRFKWDGRGIAGAMCGDLDVTHELQASVPLRSYGLEGALRLRVDGPALVATPAFEDVQLSVPIEPSAATWRFVEGADRRTRRALPRGARQGRGGREDQGAAFARHPGDAARTLCSSGRCACRSRSNAR